MTEQSKVRRTPRRQLPQRSSAGDDTQARTETRDSDVGDQHPTLVPPQDFYEQFTARPDVRKILKRLAE
jgi:hypothetical protein